jgi:hypothetical protein
MIREEIVFKKIAVHQNYRSETFRYIYMQGGNARGSTARSDEEAAPRWLSMSGH